MKAQPGKMTGEFGGWLFNFIRGNDSLQNYSVYFDHGDKEKFPNVAAIKGFYGDQVTNRNRLADIDVMVANDDNEAVLLIEIEETNSSPKKLLGDAFSVMFCNHIAVRAGNEQKYFRVCAQTRLIVAGIVPSQGNRQDKIEDMILPRLRQFNVPNDAIQVENVVFVCEDIVSDLLANLKSETKNFLAYE